MSGNEKQGDDPIAAEMKASLEALDADASKSKPRGDGEGTEQADDSGARSGVVVSVTEKDVFVELGPREQGIIPLAQFAKTPAVGDSVKCVVNGVEEDELLSLSLHHDAPTATGGKLEVGAVVSAKVVGVNTGGLELKIGKRHAFMPASHVDLHRVDDLNAYLNREITCEVIEIDKKRRRALVSRRTVLARERDQKRGEAVAALRPGAIVTGSVKRFESFGAFVEVADGIEGLLHVSNIAHKRVDKPDDVLELGQQIEVAILEVSPDGKRIGLGIKQLLPDPWDEAAQQLVVGSTVKGKVTRIAQFGAFVELFEGVDGLIHISQLSPDRIRRVTEAVNVGDEVEVRVLAVDAEKQRISLSRLDERGRVIGSVDEAEDDEVDEAVQQTRTERGGRTLGDLLKGVIDPDQLPDG